MSNEQEKNQGRDANQMAIAKNLEKNETASIPHEKFEHDLNWAEGDRYSPEFHEWQRERIERLKQVLAEASSPAPENKAAQTASSGMTRDEHMKKLSETPRFKVLKPSGTGFVIGGVAPPSPVDREKTVQTNPIGSDEAVNVTHLAAEKRRQYLEGLVAEVIAAHPDLTREEALEMLLASGA